MDIFGIIFNMLETIGITSGAPMNQAESIRSYSIEWDHQSMIIIGIFISIMAFSSIITGVIVACITTRSIRGRPSTSNQQELEDRNTNQVHFGSNGTPIHVINDLHESSSASDKPTKSESEVKVTPETGDVAESVVKTAAAVSVIKTIVESTDKPEQETVGKIQKQQEIGAPSTQTFQKVPSIEPREKHVDIETTPQQEKQVAETEKAKPTLVETETAKLTQVESAVVIALQQQLDRVRNYMERPAKFTIDTDPIRWKDIFNRYADVAKPDDPEERWKLSLELLDDDVVEELNNKFKWVMQQKLDVRQNILFEILPEITEKIKHRHEKAREALSRAEKEPETVTEPKTNSTRTRERTNSKRTRGKGKKGEGRK